MRRLRRNGLAAVAAGCADTQVASQIELQQDLIKSGTTQVLKMAP
jgi:hypothetical protein